MPTSSSASQRHGGPSPSTPVTSNDLEPDEAWKAGLKKQIEENMRSMVEDARRNYDRQINEAAAKSGDLMKVEREYKRTMEEMKRMAEEHFREELARERRERRLVAGLAIEDTWREALIKEQEVIYAQIKQGQKSAVSESPVDDRIPQFFRPRAVDQPPTQAPPTPSVSSFSTILDPPPIVHVPISPRVITESRPTPSTSTRRGSDAQSQSRGSPYDQEDYGGNLRRSKTSMSNPNRPPIPVNFQTNHDPEDRDHTQYNRSQVPQSRSSWSASERASSAASTSRPLERPPSATSASPMSSSSSDILQRHIARSPPANAGGLSISPKIWKPSIPADDDVGMGAKGQPSPTPSIGRRTSSASMRSIASTNSAKSTASRSSLSRLPPSTMSVDTIPERAGGEVEDNTEAIEERIRQDQESIEKERQRQKEAEQSWKIRDRARQRQESGGDIEEEFDSHLQPGGRPIASNIFPSERDHGRPVANDHPFDLPLHTGSLSPHPADVHRRLSSKGSINRGSPGYERQSKTMESALNIPDVVPFDSHTTPLRKSKSISRKASFVDPRDEIPSSPGPSEFFSPQMGANGGSVKRRKDKKLAGRPPNPGTSFGRVESLQYQATAPTGLLTPPTSAGRISDHDEFIPPPTGHSHMGMMFDDHMEDEDYVRVDRVNRNLIGRGPRHEPDYGPSPRSDSSEFEPLSRKSSSLKYKPSNGDPPFATRSNHIPPLTAEARFTSMDSPYQTPGIPEHYAMKSAPANGSFQRYPSRQDGQRKVRMSRDQPTVWTGAPSQPIPLPPKSAGIMRSHSQSKPNPPSSSGLAPPSNFAPSRSPRARWDDNISHRPEPSWNRESSEESTDEVSGEDEDDADHLEEGEEPPTSDDSEEDPRQYQDPRRHDPVFVNGQQTHRMQAASRRGSTTRRQLNEPVYPLPSISRSREDQPQPNLNAMKRAPSSSYRDPETTEESTDNDDLDHDESPVRYEQIKPIPTTRREPPRPVEQPRTAYQPRSSNTQRPPPPPARPIAEQYGDMPVRAEGGWDRVKNNSGSKQRERLDWERRDQERRDLEARELLIQQEMERRELDRREMERRDLEQRREIERREQERRDDLRGVERREQERREQESILEQERRDQERREQEIREQERREQERVVADLQRVVEEREKELELEREKLEKERTERERAARAEKELRDRLELDRQELERKRREIEEREWERERKEREWREMADREKLEAKLNQVTEEAAKREEELARTREEQERKNREIELKLTTLQQAFLKASEALKTAQRSAQQSATSKRVAQAEVDEMKRKVDQARALAQDAKKKEIEAIQLQREVNQKEAETKQKELDILRREKELQERELHLQRQEEKFKQQEALNKLEAMLKIKEEETSRLMEALELQKKELDHRDRELKVIQQSSRPTTDLFDEPTSPDEYHDADARWPEEPAVDMPVVPEVVPEPEPVVEQKLKVKEKKVKGKKKKAVDGDKEKRENEERERRQREEEAQKAREEEDRLADEEEARLAEEEERWERERLENERREEEDQMELERIEKEERRKREAKEREDRERIERAEKRRREDKEREDHLADETRRQQGEEIRQKEKERQERIEREKKDAILAEEMQRQIFREEQDQQHRAAVEMERQRRLREEELSRQRQGDTQRTRSDGDGKNVQQEQFRQREEEFKRRSAGRNRQHSFGEGNWQDLNYNASAPYGAPPQSTSTPKPPPPRSGSGTYTSTNGPAPAWTTWNTASATSTRSASAAPFTSTGPSTSQPSPSKSRTSTAGSTGFPQYPPQAPPLSEADWARNQAEQTRKQQERFRQEQERMEALRQARMAGAPASKENLSALHERNEKMWSMLATKDSLRWVDFPWPVLRQVNTPEDITTFGIESYICSQFYPDKSRSEKDRIKEYIKRWHPDRFETKLLVKVSEDEKEKVREGAGSVVRSLNDLLAKRNDANDWI